MLSIRQYVSSDRQQWDELVARSRSGSFLFFRDYMEYHAHRFSDLSLMVHEGSRLVGVMPGNRVGNEIVSHGGLTYGGIVTDHKTTTTSMLEVFCGIGKFLRLEGISRWVYKPMPHIYHTMPAEEDLYALFRNGARLVRRDVAAAVRLSARLSYSENRRRAVRRGIESGLAVRRSYDFEGFMDVQSQLLGAKYGRSPAHTGAEIGSLAERFPDHIKLFTASLDQTLLGGVIVFETTEVAHAQYIAATDEGKKLHALDVVFDYLLGEYRACKRYFDFGISTERDGSHLNTGLAHNKESFGARAVMYDWYQMDL